MNRFKKVISILFAILLCITSCNVTSIAFADSTQNTDYGSVSDDSQKLFSKLFFSNNEDVEKIISYFDTETNKGIELPLIKNININEIINELNLNTNYVETNCIIENVYIIEDYVENDKINDATQGQNLLDNVGGLFSEQRDFNFVVQPLWDKDTFHKNKTTSLAESYFSKTVAAKIGQYNREVDIKYSSGKGAIGLGDKSNQYIHFNEYASGSEDSRDYAASTWFIACELAWKQGKKETAYMYLGYALHPLQDKEAHGQIGRGKKIPSHTYIIGSNRHHADDETGWEWTNSSRTELKAVSGSRVRYNAAVSVTKTWLSKYKNILK